MLFEIKQVLPPSELEEIQTLLRAAPWLPGKRTAGAHAQHQKSNEEMDQSSDTWKKINQRVVTRLYENASFQHRVLPLRVSAAFIARYKEGSAYGQHIDDPVMGGPGTRYRADVSVTVFLNNPGDYTGGELIIQTKFGPTKVKLPAGNVIAYPSSSLHEVTPVTSGERLVGALWVQSLIRDVQQREILADLDEARQALQQATPNAHVTTRVDHAYMNLVRLWSEC
ncbi:MAG: Fe2+-dependent dioxygenase [Granulosicoccus sp.]